MTFRLLLGLFGTTPLCGLLCAAELTPAEAAARARKANPDLTAARLRIDEARGRLTGAGRRPNPEMQIESMLNTNASEGSLAVGWVQKFPKASKLRMERQVSQTLVDAAEAEVQAAERQLTIQVRLLAVKLLALHSQQALRAKQEANAKELAEFAAKRVATGEGAETDAAQFELEAQQIAVEALQLATEQESARAELRSLLGMAIAEPLEIRGTLATPVMPSGLPPTATRPELIAADLNATAAQQGVDLEKMRRRDDASGGLFAGWERSEDAPEGFSHEGMIGVRISIPLPWWNKNEGKIQEATATAARLAAERQALSQRLTQEASSATTQMKMLLHLVTQIDQTLLPKASALEDKLSGFYKSGQTPLTDILRARERRLQLEKSRLNALRDFHLLRASLGLESTKDATP